MASVRPDTSRRHPSSPRDATIELSLVRPTLVAAPPQRHLEIANRLALDPYELHSEYAHPLGASTHAQVSRPRFCVVATSLQEDALRPAESALQRTHASDVRARAIPRSEYSKSTQTQTQTNSSVPQTSVGLREPSALDMWAAAKREAARLAPLGFTPSTRLPSSDALKKKL